jgi:putative membrane protein
VTFDAGHVAYCGSPPLPGDVAWNLDPILFAVLCVGALAYAAGIRGDSIRQEHAFDRRHMGLFGLGWLILTLALMSPLCNLSVALFSARVGQHMIIALIAAPLMVAGGADRMLQRTWVGHEAVPGRALLVGATLAFAAAVWFWHMPAPYDATFFNDGIYWAMHITMFVSAFALWHVIVRSAPGPMLVASLITGMQMFGIGAIIALASRELYAAHLTTTWAWGLTVLQDQRLGGLIMWVPGGLILTAEILIALGAYLYRLEKADAAAASRPRFYSSVSR